MPCQLEISIGQHSDKGRKDDQSGFPRRLDSGRAAAQPEGNRRCPGGRHQQQRCQPDRQRIGGQEFPDGLLLHVGILVGEDVSTARLRGDELLASRANPPEPISLRQGPGLCLHVERNGHQVHHRAHFPCRRLSYLPLRRPRARATDRRSSGRRFIGAELSRPRLWASTPDRNRLPGRSSSKKATSFCWQPTAFTSMSARASLPADWRQRASDLDRAARVIVEEAYRRGSPTTSRFRSSASTNAGQREQRDFRQASRIAAARRCWTRRMIFDGYRIVRELHGSSRSHIYLAVDTEMTRWSSSRFHRSTCATIRPI